MQKQKTDFATIFLLEFTKQLIENSKSQEIIELEKKEKIIEPEEIKYLEKLEVKNKRQKKFPIKIPLIKQAQQINLIKKPLIKQTLQKLIIPKTKLPPRFQNIQPISTKREIDLGKLNPVLEDPMAQSIECGGPNTQIKIITSRGKKITKIILTKEEINKIIETFSKITRIPAMEGIYKVAAGNLILLAVISEIIGTKFVIRKIPQQTQRIPNQRFPLRRMPQRPMQKRRMVRR